MNWSWKIFWNDKIPQKITGIIRFKIWDNW